MWKTLKSLIVFFLSFQFSLSASYGGSAHLAKLKSQFPYGLLSDDYGILNLNDLALNACRIKPMPFVLDEIHPYEYWICFESSKVLPTCYDDNFHNEDGRVGRVYVDAHDDEFTYNFFEQRPWAIRDCKSFVKDLKRIIKGTSHTCISASDFSKEEKNEKGKLERVAFFRRLKTRKGCEGEECTLTKKFKKEHCPELQL